MSLVLKLKVDEQKDSFIVSNCTGEYTSSNTTGFGGLNPRIDDITESYLEVITPYSTKGEQPIKVDLYPDFPNHKDIGYIIMPYQVNNNDGFMPSGLWKVKWVVKGIVKGNEFEATTTVVAVFRNNIYCCVDKHTVKLDKNIATDDAQKKIVEMKNIMQATDYCIENGLFETANKNIDYLKLNCEDCC